MGRDVKIRDKSINQYKWRGAVNAQWLVKCHLFASFTDNNNSASSWWVRVSTSIEDWPCDFIANTIVSYGLSAITVLIDSHPDQTFVLKMYTLMVHNSDATWFVPFSAVAFIKRKWNERDPAKWTTTPAIMILCARNRTTNSRYSLCKRMGSWVWVYLRIW